MMTSTVSHMVASKRRLTVGWRVERRWWRWPGGRCWCVVAVSNVPDAGAGHSLCAAILTLPVCSCVSLPRAISQNYSTRHHQAEMTATCSCSSLLIHSCRGEMSKYWPSTQGPCVIESILNGWSSQIWLQSYLVSWHQFIPSLAHRRNWYQQHRYEIKGTRS